MIRYVRIGDQINDGANEFALYDTITNLFLTINGSQSWRTLDELHDDLTYDASVTLKYSVRVMGVCAHHGEPTEWSKEPPAGPGLHMERDEGRFRHVEWGPRIEVPR